MKLGLTLAISDYDHVRDLTSGKVRPEGIELTCLDLGVEEIFFRFTAFREWHVSELSLAKYCSLRASGDESLTAIPVFPSRVFRHSSFYVRRDAGIREPGDLAGRRIGVPEWAQTAGVFARGLLVHELGVSLSAVEWVQAGVNEPGRQEQVPLALPDGVACTIDSERSLNELLLAGEIDAAISAHPPDAFGDAVVRLFPEHEQLERDYYRRTGIFPIMHIVALRRDVFDEHPWVAMELLKAFETAKQRSIARLLEARASRFPLPWGQQRGAEAIELLGKLWPYGIEPNRKTLEAFLGFCHEQGVCARLLTPEELVPAEVQQEFRV